MQRLRGMSKYDSDTWTRDEWNNYFQREKIKMARVKIEGQQGKMIEIPESLARLLAAKPEDFKDPEKYEETTEVSKALLRLLLGD
jgi:hypothetical protein